MSELIRVHCGQCGIEFAMPDFFQKERRETKEAWYCPNGHPRVYRESDADKLRRERDRLQQELARVEQEKTAALERAFAAEKRETRLKKRASAGVCPCCNRTFQQLARHMQAKHPTFSAEPAAVVSIKQKRKAAQ